MLKIKKGLVLFDTNPGLQVKVSSPCRHLTMPIYHGFVVTCMTGKKVFFSLIDCDKMETLIAGITEILRV